MKIDVKFTGKKQVNAYFNGFEVKTDQSVSSGGDGTAPSPFELFLSSLATCAGIYIKGFCDQRGISSEGIKLVQYAEFNKQTNLVDHIEIEILLPYDFPEKYKDAVINAADLCLVKRHFENPPKFEIYTTHV